MKKRYLWQNYFERQRSRQRSPRRTDPAKWCLLAFVVLCLAVLVWDIDNGGYIGFLPSARTQAVQADMADAVGADRVEDSGETEESGSSGAADSSAQAASEVFAAYRLDREQSRAEELAMLEEVIADVNSSAEARTQAEQRRLQLAADIEAEAQAERLLDAEGFGETVVLKSTDRATVICALELDAIIATQIAEIVSSACFVDFENVVIVNRCTI